MAWFLSSGPHGCIVEDMAPPPTKCLGFFFPLEKPDVKQKSTKKKGVIPQIIVTRASSETLTSCSSLGSEEQRTIQEQADWGSYSRHRSPSMAAAFNPQAKE
ncbi:hypothetical protein GW7_12424 [Heterocephalus glaber]|uniref:Spermatogenesis-associated protein 33 n=1 Tax=Heterocephalus glaber TaxID=10181 RepID=G5API0_HETGA|nr:hypothetical protein GW7_12424 [Heterocephalus glaber]